jgi:hypothetical protein
LYIFRHMYAWEVMPASGRWEDRLTTRQKTEGQTGGSECEHDLCMLYATRRIRFSTLSDSSTFCMLSLNFIN